VVRVSVGFLLQTLHAKNTDKIKASLILAAQWMG
jgi:hypothetical protein